MADELDDYYKTLENVLRRFRLEHYERHVLCEVPETTWSAVTRIIKKTKRPLTSKWIAQVITSILKECSPPAESVNNRIQVLRLKLLALYDNKEWYAYELSDIIEGVVVTASTMAARIGRAARRTLSGKGYRVQAWYTLHEDLVYMILQLYKSGRSSEYNIVGRSKYNVIFVNRKPSAAILDLISEGLGYKKHKDLVLSGRHIKSLIRLHRQKENTMPERLIEMPPYKMTPRRLPNGIDFVNAGLKMEQVDRILGPDPAILNKLEISCRAPFYDDQVISDSFTMNFIIRTDNVAETLKDLVTVNAITTDSVLFNTYHNINTNKLNFTTD